MSTSGRWMVAGLVLVVAIVTALALELRGGDAGQTLPTGTGRAPGSADLAALRVRADLPPCPAGPNQPGPPLLRNVSVSCLADGRPVDPAREVAGRAVLLNLWAYWCGPCADELPAMMAYQRRAGAAVTVITVHEDPDEAAALSMLADLDVRLTTWQDGDRRVAAAVGAPNVMPTTVLLRPDGSVAAILPRAFANADEIAAAVDDRLGRRR